MYLHSWPTISVQLTSVVSLATELQAQAEAHAQMQVIKMIQEKTTFHANTSTRKIIQTFNHFGKLFKRDVIWIQNF